VAENSITFTVKATKDGSWRILAKDADAAAGAIHNTATSTDRATKAADKWSKGNKGVAQAGMNSTKAFSKMNQSMVGGGGLVGAYATLAANVFALTAAFGVLQRAAAAEQLAKGLEHTGLVAGRNLPFIADKLKEITGEAVSTQEAMSAVALATSSGFSSEQIMKLGEVAKGASLALGRDMTDALNRLIRGAAKLEPELLDELGIMVRLDTASRDYAASLGLTEGQLTQYQKRQAFVNAIISEGTGAFSGIAASVDPNPYNQLSAALQDLLKEFVTLINKALIPLVQFFSASKAGIIGGVLLFASSIKGALLPGLTGAAKGMAEFAAAHKESAIEAQQNITTTGKLPKGYKQLSHSLQEGTASYDDMLRAQQSLDQAYNDRSSNLTDLMNMEGDHSRKIAEKTAQLAEVETAQKSLRTSMLATATAARTEAASDALGAASKLQVGEAIKKIKEATRNYRTEINLTAASNGLASASFATLRTFIYSATLSLKAFGVALLTAMPYIGIFSMLIGTAMSYWDEWFGDDKAADEANEIADSLLHIAESGYKLQGTLRQLAAEDMAGSFKAWNAELKTTAGTVMDARDRLNEMMHSGLKEKNEEYQQSLVDLENAAASLAEQYKGGGWATSSEIQAYRDQVATTNDLKDSLKDIDPTALNNVLDTAVQMAELGGLSVTEEHLKGWKQAIADLDGDELTLENIQNIINAPTSTEATLHQIESISGALDEVDKEIAKIGAKTETPFDNLVSGLDEIENALEQAKGTSGEADLIAGLNASDSKLKKAMDKLGIAGDTAVDKFRNVKKVLDASMNTLQTMPGTIKKQEAVLKNLNSIRRESPEIAQAALDIEEEIRLNKIKLLDDELAIYNTMQLQEENAERIKELESERTALVAAKKTAEHEAYIVAQAQAKLDKSSVQMLQKAASAQKSLVALKEKQLRMAAEEAAFADPRRKTTTLTAKEERDIKAKMRLANINAINQEFAIKRMQVEIEFTLLDAKYDYLIAEARARDQDTTKLEAMKQTIADTKTLVLEGVNAEHGSRLLDATSTTKDDEAVRNEFMASTTQGSTTFDRMQNAFADENNAFSEQDFGDKVKAMSNMLQPMMDQMKEMGPEGELMASLSEGAFAMTDIFATTFQGITGDLQKMVDESDGKIKTLGQAFDSMDLPGKAKVIGQALGAVAGMIGQIAQMQAAKSKAAIAAIDKEIAAEKKRDGQSAKSVAKIKELEAKKEQMKRKAFETQKKLQLAQAVMATAAGIAMALSSLPPPWSFIMAGLTAAMGAMQISLISGMQYDGGAAQTPQAPGSVSAGKRRNSVDFAKSQSAAGELAYMRGASGIGGPENFQNAFAGKRYRAAGGTAGYVVGEQGPELFMPDRPGRIVPADDTENMAGGNNVTFNINTIDAVGVEEVLTEQQGNIIGMIRSAANEYGDPFLENIDTSIYSTPFAGYRRA
tara:strand:- start:6947 stop:11272 length:4326 start_codon:yes stop_codon:yes gene_type:complete